MPSQEALVQEALQRVRALVRETKEAAEREYRTKEEGVESDYSDASELSPLERGACDLADLAYIT